MSINHNETNRLDEANRLAENKIARREALDKPDTSYYDSVRTPVGEIKIGWDSGYREYTIYFTGINSEEGKQCGVYDQVLLISRLPEKAKNVFEVAKTRAQVSTDVYDVYKSVKKYIESLPDDYEGLDDEEEL